MVSVSKEKLILTEEEKEERRENVEFGLGIIATIGKEVDDEMMDLYNKYIEGEIETTDEILEILDKKYKTN